MAVDYDLVVIGCSEAGVEAAIAAARLKARVALVEQGQTAILALNHWVLLEMANTLSQTQRAVTLGLCESAVRSRNQWSQLQRWSEVAATATRAMYSPIALASLGIDVLTGGGEFVRKPTLSFVVNGRPLRSRAYLLATVETPAIEHSIAPFVAVNPPAGTLANIAGLNAVGYWNVRTTLVPRDVIDPCHRLAIIGADAIEVELAQALVRLGNVVTLITPAPRILLHEDSDAAGLIQAQLEAEGVEILTDTTVTQVRQIDQKKWVQAGTRAIEVDEILLATPPRFDPTVLNLDAAQVNYSPSGILVDRALRTSNRRIFACRSPLMHGYAPPLAVLDARLVVQNALFWSSAAAQRQVPVVTQTQPELARVGLQESEAHRLYGKDVVVVRQPFQVLLRSHIQGDTPGFCKFILRRNGHILGAHIVGAQAGEMIGTIALAMQQNIKIQAIADLALPTTAFAQILPRTAAEWQNLRLQRNTRLQTLLEKFFNWRRSMV